MSYYQEYFCPHCGATLNDQPGFDPKKGTWTCDICGQMLMDDDVFNGDTYDGVAWYCDNCGALLNRQDGFSDSYGTWICSECGYENGITDEDIRNYSDDSSETSTSDVGGLAALLTLGALGASTYIIHRVHRKKQQEEEEKAKEAEKEVEERRQEEILFYADRDRMGFKKVRTKRSKNSDQDSIFPMLLLILIPMLIFGFFYLRHNQKVSQLEQLEIEIEEAMQAKDYDLAELKINRLHLDDNYSKDESAAWDAKREALLELIAERKHEDDLADPNKIFMPADSTFFTGKQYADVVDQLSALGFTNISTQVASKSPGLFHRKGAVEHLLVGGRTEFAAEECFDKNTPIIIYYYSK